MKRRVILAMIVAAGMILSGCSTNGEDGTRHTADDAIQTEYVRQEDDIQIAGEGTEIVGNEEAPALGEISENDLGQRFSDRENLPDEDGIQHTADDANQTEYVRQEDDIQIVGEVTEIAGNEVTLALGEISENDFRQRFSDREDLPDGERAFPGENGKDFPQRGDGEGSTQRANGEGFPQRGDGEGFPQRANGEGFPQRGEGGINRRFPTSIEKNGETASYTIPEGMTLTGANGDNNDYSAVTVGMILRLTVNSDGSVVAAEIL